MRLPRDHIVLQSQWQVDAGADVRLKVATRRALKNYPLRSRESKWPQRTYLVLPLTFTTLRSFKICCPLYFKPCILTYVKGVFFPIQKLTDTRWQLNVWGRLILRASSPVGRRETYLHVKPWAIPVLGDQWRKTRNKTKKELSDAKEENQRGIISWQSKH